MKTLNKLLSFSLIFACTFTYAQNISGKIVGVMDGDTVKLLTPDNHEVKIRLAEIDAPEKAQAFGQASKKSLSDMAFGKDAQAKCTGSDRYERQICTIFVSGVNVNQAQVHRGFAWVYRQYAAKDSPLLDSERLAKSQRTGLWADNEPVPPWEYRKRQ